MGKLLSFARNSAAVQKCSVNAKSEARVFDFSYKKLRKPSGWASLALAKQVLNLASPNQFRSEPIGMSFVAKANFRLEAKRLTY